MSLKKRLQSYAIEAYLSEPAARIRRAASDASRQLRRQDETLDLYFELGDPYSYLLAQVLVRIQQSYGVAYRIHIITPPASDVDSFPELRTEYGVRDAKELAEYYDLEFPPAKNPLDKQLLLRGNAILVRKRSQEEQLEAVLAVADAAWRGDTRAFDRARGKFKDDATGSVGPIINTNYAALRKRGHYNSGTFHYGGEWFWGIDRVPYLEERLREEIGVAAPSVVTIRDEGERNAKALLEGPAATEPLVVQMFHSFRSPYSYLAVERAFAACEDAGARLQIRPVFPMVQRGAALAPDKRRYIVNDANREANRLGIPFGRICDPMGRGIENCLAAWPVAERHRRPREYLLSVGNGIWAERKDVADLETFFALCARAELPQDEVRAALAANTGKAEDSWRQAAVQNAVDLKTFGHWGVPTFRIGNFLAWGQDRIDLLRDRLRRHQLALTERPAEDAAE